MRARVCDTYTYVKCVRVCSVQLLLYIYIYMTGYIYIYTSEAPMHGRVLSRRVQYRLTLLHGLVISAAPGGWQPPIGGWRRGARRRRREYPLRVCTIADIADSVGQSHDKNQSLAASSCSRCSPSRSSFRPSRLLFLFPSGYTLSLFSPSPPSARCLRVLKLRISIPRAFFFHAFNFSLPIS